MNVEPASIDQIRQAKDGQMVLIDADVGGVAQDLRDIDPQLKVRFAETANPPFFAVYWESEDRRETYLVKTVKAHQTALGTWAGLDQRLVEEIRAIDPHGRGGYDYAAELERNNKRVDEDRRARFRERVGGTAEEAAHAIRKDLGVRYRGRAFIPRDLA